VLGCVPTDSSSVARTLSNRGSPYTPQMTVRRAIRRRVERVLGRRVVDRIDALLTRDPRFLAYALKRLVRRPARSAWPQSVPAYAPRISLVPGRLAEDLAARGFCVHRGGHAAYLHEPADLQAFCPEMVERYPSPFGLKIFKSTERAGDGSVYYVSPELKPATTPLTMWTVGSVREKAAVGNVLNNRHLTPRVHDLVWLHRGDAAPLMAMVVEHAGHEPVHGEEGGALVRRLRAVCREEGITALGEGFEHASDFAPPKFGENIVRGAGGPVYVDVQNLAFEDPDAAAAELAGRVAAVTHFGDTRPFRGGAYCYQEIPWLGGKGKRDVSLRAERLEAMLQDAGCSIEGARVVDVGCNVGVFLAFFLWKGAAWCIGLDRPEVADAAGRLLSYFAYTRFDVVGCDLREDVAEPALEGPIDVLLLLAITHHIGFPAWVRRLDWRYLVFEGAGNEKLGSARKRLLEGFPGARVAGEQVVQDGDSPPRPLIVLCRS